jgi:hypothetical protein
MSIIIVYNLWNKNVEADRNIRVASPKFEEVLGFVK